MWPIDFDAARPQPDSAQRDDSQPAPEEYTGGIIGDLNSRRGQIAGTTSRGNAQVVNAMVPLANMFGYVNNLRSMSQGRAAYTMLFDHYSEVPRNVADEVVAKYA